MGAGAGGGSGSGGGEVETVAGRKERWQMRHVKAGADGHGREGR